MKTQSTVMKKSNTEKWRRIIRRDRKRVNKTTTKMLKEQILNKQKHTIKGKTAIINIYGMVTQGELQFSFQGSVCILMSSFCSTQNVENSLSISKIISNCSEKAEKSDT